MQDWRAYLYTACILSVPVIVIVSSHTGLGEATPPWANPDWYIAIGTIALAVVTSLLWVATYRLWQDAKEQREISRASLRLAQETAKKQLRAYIGCIQANAELKIGSRPIVHLKLKNAGVSPGLVEEFLVNMVVSKIGRPNIPSPLPATEASTMPIMPGGYMEGRWEVGEIWTDTDQRAFVDGQLKIEVNGRVVYLDIYDERHKTDFNLIYSKDHRTVETGLMIPRSEGNSMT